MKKSKPNLECPECNRTGQCHYCHGSGSKGNKLCPECNGTGRCHYCYASISKGNYQIKVEGSKANEVKNVASFLLNQTDKAKNTKVKLPEVSPKEKHNSKWDVFISHASEDKSTFVKKLADALS